MSESKKLKSPALDALKIEKPKEDSTTNATSPKINFNNPSTIKRNFSITSSSPELSSLNASLSTISHFGSAASILMGGIKAKRMSETEGKEPGTPFKLANVDSSLLPAFPLLSAYSSAAQTSTVLPSVESVLNHLNGNIGVPVTEVKRSRAKKAKAPQTESPKNVEKDSKKPRKTRPISHLQLFPFDVTSHGLLSAIQNKSDDGSAKKEESDVTIPLNINPVDSNPLDVDIPNIGKLTNKTPKKPRASRSEVDTHNASLPPELASLLPDAGNGSGSSCHQCKSLRDVLIYCSSMFAQENSPVGTATALSGAVKDKRKICHKKYCVSCLKKFYNEVPPLPFNNPAMFWACPACRGFCECAACRRRSDKPSDKAKLAEVKLQRAEYQLQLLVQHHQDLIHNTQTQHNADEQKASGADLTELKAKNAEIVKGLLENFTAQMRNLVSSSNKDGVSLQECPPPALLTL